MILFNKQMKGLELIELSQETDERNGIDKVEFKIIWHNTNIVIVSE